MFERYSRSEDEESVPNDAYSLAKAWRAQREHIKELDKIIAEQKAMIEKLQRELKSK